MYDGTHSITFMSIDGSVEFNTWEDWYLIPTSRPTMSIPGSQNKFIEIQGMSWSYDNSDYLIPDVSFVDRSGNFEFLVDNDHVDLSTLRNTLMATLNGKRLKMVLEDDPDWYYEGRFTLSDFKSDPKNSRVSIGYRVYPFKISINADFIEHVIWDTFNFERDYDWSVFWHISLDNEERSYYVTNYRVKTTIFARLVSGTSVNLMIGETVTTLNTPGIVVSIEPTSQIGSGAITLSGTGIVDIGFRKISL